jgi:hypothetical protein
MSSSPPSLLERQRALIDYLSNPHAFLLSNETVQLSGADFDSHRLKLLGQFAFNKRLKKIQTVLPKTISFLQAQDQDRETLRNFFAHWPADGLSAQSNARQLAQYLAEAVSETHSYLADVAALELALHVVRRRIEDESAPAVIKAEDVETCQEWRVRPGFEIIRCRYDLRQLFEMQASSRPGRRDATLLVCPNWATAQATVLEIDSELSARLAMAKASPDLCLLPADAKALDVRVVRLLCDWALIEPAR